MMSETAQDVDAKALLETAIKAAEDIQLGAQQYPNIFKFSAVNRERKLLADGLIILHVINSALGLRIGKIEAKGREGEPAIALCYPFGPQTCSDPKCDCREEKAHVAALVAAEQELERWKEDSLVQARTIKRMTEAAEDRNAVDKTREAFHAQDLAAKDARISELEAERERDESRDQILKLHNDLIQAQGQLRYYWGTYGHCACGAIARRPETHGHVSCCPTEIAAEAARKDGEP